MMYLEVTLQVVLLVILAAIFSGLNISLMSLDTADLRRKAKLGNADAKRVLPLRQHAYLSLAAILFTNVAVISVSSLLIDSYFNGWIAAIATTILIVIFGELVPQALFVKKALRFSAFFAPLIRLVIFVTYPLSKPLAIILNKIIGRENKGLRSRAELGLLINEYKLSAANVLDDDEVEIVQSTLKLSTKTVRDILRSIDEVFWLCESATIDAGTVDDIKRHGYSRIPVFDKDLTQCFGVLLMKDMVDINFGANPIEVTKFKVHPTETIGVRTALDTTFRKFASIHSHMVPVLERGKIVGVITVEDLIEEILGHEIIDETDYAHNRA